MTDFGAEMYARMKTQHRKRMKILLMLQKDGRRQVIVPML